MTQVTDVVDFNETWYSTATNDEQKMFREWLLGVLRMHETVEVVFTKKDGSDREMKCTLKESIIPAVEKSKESDTLCTVWDTVLNQWRSFHFDKIKKINFQM